MFYRLYKDPLVRRFISGSFFAGAFVWVAIRFFDVPLEIVRIFLIYSFGFVGILIVFAILLVPVVRLFSKPRSSLLQNIPEDQLEEPADSKSSRVNTD